MRKGPKSKKLKAGNGCRSADVLSQGEKRVQMSPFQQKDLEVGAESFVVLDRIGLGRFL